MVREDLRNVAIIAHVDHGKTTLVDGMLRQSGTFRDNQQVQTCVMDSGALERERGITILAKNTSVHWGGVKINIIDTPGHADFSGEVERVLKMVSGVILLVDAAEGPMPQTRFVVEKALELGLKIIIVVNKIDRPDARLSEVGDEVLELLLDLGADDEQLMSPILYCSGKNATATRDYNVPGTDLKPLFETILNYIEPPEGDPEGDLQLLVSAIDYNDYVGRIGIGKIERGTVKVGEEVMVCDYTGLSPYKSKVVTLFQIEGLKRTPVEEAQVGDIIVMTGGRIGKDGIHGATFSSEELHEGSPATAVQIGDPITQRKMYDFIMRARDLGLYNAITDNGAGGLSSSVGEMSFWLPYPSYNIYRPSSGSADMGWPVFQRKTEESMVYAGMNGMEGIGKAVLNGVGGDREKMGEEEEREKRSFDQFAMLVNPLENDRKKEAEREKSREREEKFAKKE